jgi:soluble cytochrome b562
MKKALTVLAALTLLGSSSLAVAHDMGDEMGIIAKNYKEVLTTDSVDTFKQALEKMREASLASKDETPGKLAGKAADSPEMKEFRQGMDTLIKQIDEAMALAKQGKLAEARKVAEEFKQTRDVNHKKFR